MSPEIGSEWVMVNILNLGNRFSKMKQKNLKFSIENQFII